MTKNSLAGVFVALGVDILEGSSMRRIVPEMQAALLGRMNSKPSHDTKVTYSGAVDSAIVPRARVA